MANKDFDLLVIGSGPAGQKAAICAAKLGKKAAIVERKQLIGGVCVNTGTIPSKTMREAVLYLSGFRERNLYGESYAVKHEITAADLFFRCQHVITHEIEVIRHQLFRNGVELIGGEASFIDPHTIALNGQDLATKISSQHIVIAVGTVPAPVKGMAEHADVILDSDSVLSLDHIPKSICVIGGGVIGCEYASMFAALGTRVTLVEKRNGLLPFVDEELTEAFSYQLRRQRATLRLGEEVADFDVTVSSSGEKQVITRLKSGKQIITDKALYSAGRTGATKRLGLELAGLTPDDRGRIKVKAYGQTDVSHIYAVGDVIGFPSLASTSMEQGRLAAAHAFGAPTNSTPELFPYGIYTIPEMSVLGKTEKELTDANVPYEIGKAMYKEIARGQIIGDEAGFLKLIFHRETKLILGVHIIGEGASELVHIGQAVMSLGGTIDYFVRTVFNYPTLAECYRVAALDGINRMR